MDGQTTLRFLNSLPIDIIMWIIFGVLLIVFGVYSAILLWHWKIYSTGKFTTVSNMIMYLAVSAFFLLIMIFSVLIYTYL